MIKVEGKYEISATVLLDSVTPEGVRLLTFENEKPRIILAEENTHRALSKNSASSRAIPFAKMAEQLKGRPVRFGQANPGMQDKGEDFDALINGYTAEEWWHLAMLSAKNFSEAFYDAGYHKQVYNRLTEPFQMMKTVMSGTEWNNYFWLRDDNAADPTIAEVAQCMRVARESSTPMMLYPGEWHLPYVERWRDGSGILHYGIEHDNGGTVELTLEQAIKVSAARCAAVSFRNVDYGLEKSEQVHARLVGDERKHSSAMEHQATPMKKADLWNGEAVNVPQFPDTWEDGISHLSKDRSLWSGNFRGWIQYRKTIPGENMAG